MKYHKTLAYGLLPLIALKYLMDVLYVPIVYEEAFGFSTKMHFLEIPLYILAAVFLIREVKAGVIFVHLAFLTTVVRYAVITVWDIKDGVISYIIQDIVWLIFVLIILVVNIIYYKKNPLGASGYQFPLAEENYESKKMIVFKSIILTVMMLFVTLSTISILSDLNNITFTLINNKMNLSLLKQENVSRACFHIAYFLELFVGIWLAVVMNKSGIVSFEKQGLGSKKEPVKNILIGFLVALLVVVLACIILKIMGSGFSLNKIYPRIIYGMSLSVVYFIGVAVFEEVISRGVILGYCVKHGMKAWGVIWSSIYFVAMHFITGAYSKLTQAVFLAGGALLYAALLMYSRNLFLCIGYHFMYDWAVTHLVEIRTLNNKEAIISVLKLTYWKQAICIAIPTVVIALVLFVMAKNKEERIKSLYIK